MAKAAWLVLGCLCVALGIAGVALPLLPTTPFALLAAFAFARSSDRLHAWLLNHPTLGPAIANWQAHKAVSLRAKRAGIGFMFAALVLSAVMEVRIEIIAVQAVVMFVVAGFLWSLPLPPDQDQ